MSQNSLFIDKVQKRLFLKSFQPSPFWHAFFHRDSSLTRIPLNTTITTIVSGLWAVGMNKYTQLPPLFVSKYVKFSALFGVVYFTAFEVFWGTCRSQFKTTNYIVPGLFSALTTISLISVLPRSTRPFGNSLVIKHALHVLLYSFYFEMTTIALRDRFLRR